MQRVKHTHGHLVPDFIFLAVFEHAFATEAAAPFAGELVAPSSLTILVLAVPRLLLRVAPFMPVVFLTAWDIKEGVNRGGH